MNKEPLEITSDMIVCRDDEYLDELLPLSRYSHIKIAVFGNAGEYDPDTDYYTFLYNDPNIKLFNIPDLRELVNLENLLLLYINPETEILVNTDTIKEISLAGIKDIPSFVYECKELRTLDIAFNEICHFDIKKLASLPKLHTLNVSGTFIFFEDIMRLRELNPNIYIRMEHDLPRRVSGTVCGKSMDMCGCGIGTFLHCHCKYQYRVDPLRKQRKLCDGKFEVSLDKYRGINPVCCEDHKRIFKEMQSYKHSRPKSTISSLEDFF